MYYMCIYILISDLALASCEKIIDKILCNIIEASNTQLNLNITVTPGCSAVGSLHRVNIQGTSLANKNCSKETFQQRLLRQSHKSHLKCTNQLKFVFTLKFDGILKLYSSKHKYYICHYYTVHCAGTQPALIMRLIICD